MKLENRRRITNSRPPPRTLVSRIINPYTYSDIVDGRGGLLLYLRVLHTIMSLRVLSKTEIAIFLRTLFCHIPPAAREQMVDCNGRHLVYNIKHARKTHKRPIHTARTTGWLLYTEKLTFVSTPLPGRGENLARSFNLIAHICIHRPPGCPQPI